MRWPSYRGVYVLWCYKELHLLKIGLGAYPPEMCAYPPEMSTLDALYSIRLVAPQRVISLPVWTASGSGRARLSPSARLRLGSSMGQVGALSLHIYSVFVKIQ